jgi:PAS domain S-box-containing protein
MLSYQPVQDEAGEILGVCISITDISAFKQKEEALRESEDHYRHAVELNPQIPWVMDPEGNNISVSSRWESVTGLTQERTKNYGWLDAVHPEDRERVLATLQSSLRSGAPIDLEYRVSSDEKTWIWMRSRGAARRDASGAIVRWYGSVESMDDHKRALDELRGSEARLRAIFDAAPAGIILVESDTGKVLSANPRAERLIGFQFKTGMVWSAEGWQAFNASGQPIDGSDLPLMRAMRLRETTDAEEVLLHRPDGSKIWLSLTAAPVCLENGTQLGGVLVVQDIYTGKRECERLIEHARELANVASRTAEIYHYPAS